ncbi:MAG: bifunctional phosphoribosylaminoimidazolecarboxamide formyltransferase/IMP cyclohydrolase, partial [Myxococcota bacterium]
MSRPRALLSVSNKHGLADFAQQLVDAGYELLSTGGTARALREAGLPVTSVSDVTEHPEILDGRVKTLHPRIHGGILFRRDDDSHRHTLAEHNIGPIDIVVVNLYPFEATVARDGVTWADAIENIDIGGPTLVRAAAKSCDAVTVVVDPKDYPTIGAAIADGGTSTEQRRSLALKAFEHTSRYDQAISAWFHQQLTSSEATEEKTPAQIDVTLQCAQTLRYGENPHQQAGLYHPPTEPELGGIYGPMKRLWGKALSYNNVLDLDAAVALVAEFEAPAASVIKHTNPAGCAVVPEA